MDLLLEEMIQLDKACQELAGLINSELAKQEDTRNQIRQKLEEYY